MSDDSRPAAHAAPSGARDFQDLVTARMSRRNLLVTGALVAAQVALSGGATALARTGTGTAGPGFVPVAANSADRVTVPAGHRVQVLAPWGAPLSARGGPAWRRDGTNTAAEQAAQIGSHHSGLAFLPSGRGTGASRRGTLLINHESVDPVLQYAGGRAGDRTVSAEQVAKGLAAQGVTALPIRRRGDGSWAPAGPGSAARVTGTTPVVFSGPLTSVHPALRTGEAPVGTLSNTGRGVTPWGSFLSCEENANGWFGTEDPSWRPTATQRRYGLSARGHGHRWHTAAPRFDLAATPNEPHRYGWIVEVDPSDPAGTTPVKRTALGRFNHSSAAAGETRDGRVVVYSGDDQDGGYLYKFVGDSPWKSVRARGRSPLDHGVLHVARFHEDGTGEWLPLVHGRAALTTALGWKDQADVVLRAREAADALGATRMDRPQQIAVSPVDGAVHCALANGSGGHSHAVGPRDANPYGHIVRWQEETGTGTGFHWDVFLLGGDPALDPEVRADACGQFAAPKGLAFGSAGQLWISTGISADALNRAERGHAALGNNALLAADPRTGRVSRFLTAPRGAEVTGVSSTPDGRTLFVNIQHPGSATAAWGAPTAANPAAVSDWPDRACHGRPRSATIAVRREDGGVIGAV
ncbi:PhoX family protein [Streptomyces sp. NPDC002530]